MEFLTQVPLSERARASSIAPLTYPADNPRADVIVLPPGFWSENGYGCRLESGKSGQTEAVARGAAMLRLALNDSTIDSLILVT